MDLLIRQIKEEDFSELFEIWDSEFNEFWSSSILKSEVNNPSSICFIAKYDEKIIAFASLWKSIDDIHITNIIVKKEFRNKKIGASLLAKLVNVSQELGFNSITLEVNENNIIAIKLYEKYNFKKLGVRKKYYNNIENAIIMTLTLN